MLSVSLELLVVLIVISFVSGVGCTAIGAGGIFVTIALYALTPLSSAEVAGTAHVIFILVGAIGAVGYARSGELLDTAGRTLAVILSATSIVGAVVGAYLNAFVSRELFSILLGVLVALTGVLLLYGQLRGLSSYVTLDAETTGGRVAFAVVGFALGATSGLVGIGGPVIGVPALVMLGVPMLLSLGVAQVQAIFISGFAAGSYAYQDAISLEFASIIGLPLVLGAAGGWAIAHRIDPTRLEMLLGLLLIPTGFYLIV
ncbi:sulfite exporter TauE/SafE family protein [Natronolimnohabitans innermongolicus]|nr:sulfite exporter TauE/SafE family protein [Natronolimnohabitans innermongolicus]